MNVLFSGPLQGAVSAASSTGGKSSSSTSASKGVSAESRRAAVSSASASASSAPAAAVVAAAVKKAEQAQQEEFDAQLEALRKELDGILISVVFLFYFCPLGACFMPSSNGVVLSEYRSFPGADQASEEESLWYASAGFSHYVSFCFFFLLLCSPPSQCLFCWCCARALSLSHTYIFTRINNLLPLWVASDAEELAKEQKLEVEELSEKLQLVTKREQEQAEDLQNKLDKLQSDLSAAHQELAQLRASSSEKEKLVWTCSCVPFTM